jgi:hypothetical protein
MYWRAAILAVADDALGILHGHLAGSLDKEHGSDGDGEEKDNLNDEHHQTALRAG